MVSGRASSHGARVNRKHASGWIIPSIAALAVLLSLRALFWVGYIGSDDENYLDEVDHWQHSFPYLATSHWGLRQTLVLPLVLLRHWLGDRPEALLFPILLYACGCVVVLAVLMRRQGWVASAVALALIVTNVQFVTLSSIAYIDFAEMFFDLLVITLFVEAMRHEARRPLLWLFLSGVAAGLAMVSRETSAFLVLGIGLLFILGFGRARWTYFVFGAGFASVIASEMLTLYALSGDILYRYHVVAAHDDTINRLLDQGSGITPIHPLIDPILMLLFNHNFGLLFSLGLALAIWAARLRGKDSPTTALTLVLGCVALLWTLIAAMWWSQLVLVPRYYVIPSILLSILAALGLSRLGAMGRPIMATLAFAALIGSNLAGLFVSNGNFMWGEHELVTLAATSPGLIHTDHQTYRRAGRLLHWAHEDQRVTDAPPVSGDLFYVNPPRLPPGFQPDPAWIIAQQPALPESPAQRLASALRSVLPVPGAIIEKLRGHPGAVLYRLP